MRTHELRTARGAAIERIDDRKAAIRKANVLRDTFPGLVVVEVTVPAPIERRVWTDRIHLVEPLSSPA